MKSSRSRSSTHNSGASGVTPGNDSAAPKNQLFLSYVLNWFPRGRKLDVADGLIAVVAGFGIGLLCKQAQSWLGFPTGLPQGASVAVAATAGATVSLAVYRRLADSLARQSAAVTLAGALLDANRECMKLLDVNGRMLQLSEHGAALMDAASPAQLVGADWLGFWEGESRAAARSSFAGALLGNRASFRGLCHTTTGRPKWWDSRLIPLRDDAGRVVAVVCASLDITSQTDLLTQLQEKNELMSEMEAHMPMVFYSYSANFERFHYVSAGAAKVFGLTPAVLRENPGAWLDLVIPEDLDRLHEEMQRIVMDSADGKAQYRIRKADGSVRWLRSTAYPVQDRHGRIVRIIGTTEDVTTEQERIVALDWMAYTDSLTGLANRAALVREIERRCAASAPFGLMFVDLDRFKVLNDTLGHVAADRLLKGIADIIRAALPPDAFVARLGGDEFAALIGGVAQKAELERLAETLLGELSRGSHDVRAAAFVTASIGISLYPEHGAGHEPLLTSADVAMYAAKKAGRNGFRFAGKEAAQTIGDFELERDLPDALASGQFMLHFQAIHEPGSLSVHSAEALIRWHHPTRGLVAPGVFIPILEEMGFVADVGVWVLNGALSQLATWRRGGANNLGMSVNVSARQLRDEAIVEEVDRALKKYGIPPEKLEIELTETGLMEDPFRAQKTIAALTSLGVRIAIDDFGTGYSSLKYLADFAPHTLKIDQSFTAKLAHDAATRIIVEGIIGLSHKLGIVVIAEGVEQQEQLNILREVKCDYVQGFFLGRPETPECFSASLNLPGLDDASSTQEFRTAP
jgi:diguanylate cyclase (GGDEF)-like protein/PAS domain S-box-containing protein